MKLKQLANTDIFLSPLTLGTVKFGRNQSVKYPQTFDLPSDRDIQHLLSAAFDRGITTLDTAPAYGIAEERLGHLIQHDRHNISIISKAGEDYSLKQDKSHFDYSPDALNEQLRQSLRNLKTDYLDLWLLHSDGNDIQNLSDDVLNVFQQAKKDGWVRAIGMSTKTVEGGEYALQHMDCIMMASSLAHDKENALFGIAEDLQKSILLKKIFDSGWALTKDDKTERGDKTKILEDTFARHFSNKSLCSAVIGTSNPLHLKENITAFNQVHHD